MHYIVLKVETYVRQVGWIFYAIDFFYFEVEYRGQNVGSLTSSKQFLGPREEPRGQKWNLE